MFGKQVYDGLVGLAVLRRFSHSDSVVVRRDFDDLRFSRVGFDNHGDSLRHDESMTQRTPAINDIEERCLTRLLLHEFEELLVRFEQIGGGNDSAHPSVVVNDR